MDEGEMHLVSLFFFSQLLVISQQPIERTTFHLVA